MPHRVERLQEIRRKIDEIDDAIAELLIKRMKYARQARAEKMRMKMPVTDLQREKEVIERWRAHARRGNNEVSEDLLQRIAELVTEYTRREELRDAKKMEIEIETE
ncbi:MAG: hypothetical protein C4B56_00320 [Candidatus Methanophagaceae archaeon]|nr:MAG: hypothetical protein C4B56_00320 [Methanophagales archaeon]